MNHVPAGKYAVKCARSDAVGSSSVIVVASSVAKLRCVATSNRRIDSTSSPNSSIRTGSSASGAKISRMPPRNENSPGNSTAVVACPPRSDEPPRQLLLIHPPANANLPRRRRHRIPPRHRLQQTLNTGDDDRAAEQGAWTCSFASLPAPCAPRSQLPSAPATAPHKSHHAPRARPAPLPKPETPPQAASLKSARSRAIASISPGCGATTTSGPGQDCASAAATSAREDPQTPPSVPPCPASRLATTSAKPRCNIQICGQLPQPTPACVRSGACSPAATEVAAVAVSISTAIVERRPIQRMPKSPTRPTFPN